MTPAIFALLVRAAGATVALSAAAILLGLGLGLMVSGAALSRHRALALAARTYVSFFRGVPLLVQLLLLYNLLPGIGLDLPSVVAALIGLTLSTSAYQAENLRGGFLSVPAGVLEAADMAGLSPLQQFWRIRVPIAVKLTLPALVSEAIMIMKSSSLVSVVGVIELTQMAKDVAASTFLPLPVYAAAGGLYIVIASALAGLGAGLERRWRWGRAA